MPRTSSLLAVTSLTSSAPTGDDASAGFASSIATQFVGDGYTRSAYEVS